MEHQHAPHGSGKTQKDEHATEHHAAKEKHPAEGEAIAASRATALWSAAGFAAGALIGGVLGAAIGRGALAVPGSAPLVVNGAGVPALVLATVLGSLLAAAGGIWSLLREPGVPPPGGHGAHGSGFLMQVPELGPQQPQCGRAAQPEGNGG